MEHSRSGGGVRGEAVTAGRPAHANASFGADPAHVHWFSEHVVQSLGGAAPLRVLDIGCGDGALILHLAEVMPHSSFLGVDLSDANIAAATAAISRSPHQSRLAVVRNDYLDLDAGRFDLLIASSSLQGIDATPRQLADKLAHDVASGGRLIHVTPYRCLYNTALNIVRGGLRRIRSAATDRMILTVARMLHPGHPYSVLRERVDYMYLVLRHYEDDVRAAMRIHDFQLVAVEPAPHTSLGQPRHRFAVMSAPSRG
jgi:SAM-dependent methyltransferase